MKEQTQTLNPKEAVKFLLQSFRLERYFYLGITLVSIVLLGYCVYILIQKQDITNILVMLAPTGVITYACSRILKMWTDCLDFYKTTITKKA
ncbi:MAG: hypothetical protein Q8867_04955 [Bacteroidota bacterium]|nr:hypothetical protein [Bacteroidota bacterium]